MFLTGGSDFDRVLISTKHKLESLLPFHHTLLTFAKTDPTSASYTLSRPSGACIIPTSSCKGCVGTLSLCPCPPLGPVFWIDQLERYRIVSNQHISAQEVPAFSGIVAPCDGLQRHELYKWLLVLADHLWQ